MFLKKALLIFSIFFLVYQGAQGQCNTLRPQISIQFDTDQDCAPVTVTQFKIRYFFNAPQDPASISILYEWNDPANSTTLKTLGNGLLALDGNTSFSTDTAFFTYTDNGGQCGLRPTVSLYINGVLCPTSRETQTAFFWGRDDQANGVVTMNPPSWDVCYDNPITNARFTDASDFNCNITVEPDNPNRLERHVQFVYGTNHNPAATIRDLTLTDGGPQALTDGTGSLVNPTTRGIGMPVTAAYFGPIDAVAYPADAPTSQSFVMNAPTNALNVVGNRFEVTMFNWNFCNPWNGDAANPNYEDAVITRGYITIVEAPAPNFVTRDANNVVTTNFCINETIFMRNLTPNIQNYGYTWRFYDDAAGTNLLAQRTSFNPTFSYATGGQKLIRLIASNPTAQSPCIEEITMLVNITPALSANISVTDLSNNPITPDFCQEAASPLTNFDVRFTDASVGTVTPTTRWRWEFYDQNNNIVFHAPGAGAYSTTPLGPFDRVFTTPGVYRARLYIRDNVTSCESMDEKTVRVFEKPVPVFTFDRVCIGNAIHFTEASTVDAIAGEQIILREWDMDYDGVTFNKEPALDNNTDFNFTFSSSGTHRVALRVTTNTGSCSSILAQDVVVDPLPNASITSDITSGCSVLTVNFTNNAIAGQPDLIDEYHWEVNDGSGFVLDSIQRPSDPGFSSTYTMNLENETSTNRTFDVRLRVITVHGCEQLSNVITITVNPGPTSGFVSLNYSPFNNNCSPVSVDFIVDSETQALNPTDYIWTITDANGVVAQTNTGTVPEFTYVFTNSTQMLKDYEITLSTMLPTGCSDDSTRMVRISPIPSGDFMIDTTTNTCQVMSLNFEADQKGLVEYAWTVLLNNTIVFTSTTVGDTFDYNVNKIATDQTLEVRLITTNVTNCQSTQVVKSIVIPRSNNLSAAFTATPLVQQLPNATVTITNQSTPGPWQYLWEFDDGTDSTNPNVGTHTYTAPGTYSITLTVSDNTCSDSSTVTVQINPIPPIVDFSYNPPSGCAPLTVDFTNLSQFADPSTYYWRFGANEGSSKAIDPSYTYFEPGIYTVSLSAANATGDTVVMVKSMIIEVFESPTAQFSVYPQVLDIPGDILYTRNRSIGATSYHWDFGDNTTSTDFEPQHKYETEGLFEVELIAYGLNGCNDTTRLSSPVRTELSGQVLIPNAFAPNLTGPGSTNKLNNEVFIPLMNRVSKFQMYIFNRWGTLLFESSNQELGWDGYYQGKLCPQDVYIYKIILEYDDGKKITRTGDINLIR